MEMTPFLRRSKVDDAIEVVHWDNIKQKFRRDEEVVDGEAYHLHDTICDQKVHQVKRLEYIWQEERPFSVRMTCAGQHQQLCMEIFSQVPKQKFSRLVPMLPVFTDKVYSL